MGSCFVCSWTHLGGHDLSATVGRPMFLLLSTIIRGGTKVFNCSGSQMNKLLVVVLDIIKT